MSCTARKAGEETVGGDSFPPGLIANVAGTRALVAPPPDELGGLVEPRVDPVAAVVVAGDGVEVLLPAV